MNIKNTFKKMVAILGIAGISIMSFAIPPKKLPPRKPGAEIVQPNKKAQFIKLLLIQKNKINTVLLKKPS